MQRIRSRIALHDGPVSRPKEANYSGVNSLFVTSIVIFIVCFIMSCTTSDRMNSFGEYDTRNCLCNDICTMFKERLITSKISGIVLTKDNTPVDKAWVILSDANDNKRMSIVKTGQDGKFSFPRIKQGDYTIKVESCSACCVTGFIEVKRGKERGLIVKLYYCDTC